MSEFEFCCPVCGGHTYTPAITLKDRVSRTTNDEFQLVRCRSCGLLRLYPTPSESELERAYPSDYAPHVRPGLSGRAKGLIERRNVRHPWSYFRPPRRVLDIGCATGDLLLAIRDAGNPEIYGVEPGEGAAEIARTRGIEVFQGDVQEANYDAGWFSTVLASHTIEHIHRPDLFLAEVNRIVQFGGALILWLPNGDSVEARALKQYWIGYDAPRHLTTFDIGTLTQALGNAGFRVTDIQHEWVGLEWAWALRLYLRDRKPQSEPFLKRVHPILIAAGTPMAATSALLKKSGRVRVIAIKDREL